MTERTITVRVYLRSGRVLTLPAVLSVSYFKNRAATSFEIELNQAENCDGERLLVPSLVLSQIDAITAENEPLPDVEEPV